MTTPALIHEGNSKGEHRLIRIHPDGTNECSAWVSEYTLAALGKYLANVGSDAALPVGVFTVHELPHQVLP